eukprot:7023812-Ditylum_brightwellii.AAC.1
MGTIRWRFRANWKWLAGRRYCGWERGVLGMAIPASDHKMLGMVCCASFFMDSCAHVLNSSISEFAEAPGGSNGRMSSSTESCDSGRLKGRMSFSSVAYACVLGRRESRIEHNSARTRLDWRWLMG